MTTKPKGTRDRVNAAVVHREIMNLFGEICPARQRRFFSCTINNQTGPLVEQGPGVWRGCRSTRANEAANGARRRGALRSNAWRDWTEVSRGRKSLHPHARRGTAKGRTRMNKEER